MIELKSYVAHSHQGPYLQINEDAVYVDLAHKLYLIFDGFGGSGVGEKVVDELKENIRKTYSRTSADPDSTMPYFHSPKYVLEGNALINSMKYAQALLNKKNREKEMNERGGASAIAISQSENILTLVSVGNCMAYLYRKGSLKTLCWPDHFESLAKDSFARHFQTAPLSAFGLFDELHFNIKEVRPNLGDLLILLTDGSYSRMDENELKHILQGESKSAGSKVRSIFDLNNSRGNLDNQSALVLQF